MVAGPVYLFIIIALLFLGKVPFNIFKLPLLFVTWPLITKVIIYLKLSLILQFVSTFNT